MEQSFAILTNSLPLHTIFTLGFYVTATVYIVFTAIFYYHWKEYSTDHTVTKATLWIYLITTIPLITAIGIMTLVI